MSERPAPKPGSSPPEADAQSGVQRSPLELMKSCESYRMLYDLMQPFIIAGIDTQLGPDEAYIESLRGLNQITPFCTPITQNTTVVNAAVVQLLLEKVNEGWITPDSLSALFAKADIKKAAKNWLNLAGGAFISDPAVGKLVIDAIDNKGILTIEEIWKIAENDGLLTFLEVHYSHRKPADFSYEAKSRGSQKPPATNRSARVSSRPEDADGKPTLIKVEGSPSESAPPADGGAELPEDERPTMCGDEQYPESAYPPPGDGTDAAASGARSVGPPGSMQMQPLGQLQPPPDNGKAPSEPPELSRPAQPPPPPSKAKGQGAVPPPPPLRAKGQGAVRPPPPSRAKQQDAPPPPSRAQAAPRSIAPPAVAIVRV
ncbi:hypothetical protein ACFL2V_04560, partial [Pseudomonadota bacterium]